MILLSVLDSFFDLLVRLIEKDDGESKFVQYNHIGACRYPCNECSDDYYRIFERGTGPRLPRHPNCDCRYEDVEVIKAGTVSRLGKDGPDYWLKTKGRLPDYYITKAEAEALGWKSGRNTLAGKAPGKMIGGDIYENKNDILPVKEGRIWYECDVDYISGTRGGGRLLYSNDGLMFYSPTHYKGKFYLVELEEE